MASFQRVGLVQVIIEVRMLVLTFTLVTKSSILDQDSSEVMWTSIFCMRYADERQSVLNFLLQLSFYYLKCCSRMPFT